MTADTATGADIETRYPTTNTRLCSLLTADGALHLSLHTEALRQPAAEEVVVRIKAAPLNPSDLGLLLAGADPATATVVESDGGPLVTCQVPPAVLSGLASRFGQSLPVGNEAAGIVIASGEAQHARALVGQRVSMFGGAMFARYRVINAAECMVLPEGTTAAEGASSFVNPLTALAMIGTMRREGHTALVHTAAASNLGQMLVRLCAADGVPLVNLVRRPEQAEILRHLGATHICDSTKPGFREELVAALAETQATIAFDAIGGGTLVGDILAGMEAAAQQRAGAYSRYGSSIHKQVYLYGGLDPAPTQLARTYGMAWGIGGWLLMSYLQSIDQEQVMFMRRRVADNLKTIFASHYTRTITLTEALDPEIMRAYARRATGEKYLIVG